MKNVAIFDREVHSHSHNNPASCHCPAKYKPNIELTTDETSIIPPVVIPSSNLYQQNTKEFILGILFATGGHSALFPASDMRCLAQVWPRSSF